jgi:Fe-S-cluster containining protein
MTDYWSSFEHSWEGLEQLSLIYMELEQRITVLQNATGISCLKFCKQCCNIPGVRITVSLLETLPLCIHWWKKGQAQLWLNRLSRTDDRGDHCLLFQPDNPSAWGCRYYQWRPLLCRMFCFCAALDKQGQARPMLCQPLQSHFPEWPQLLAERLPANFQFPIYSELASRVAGINPVLARTYPINRAFREGLELVGLKLQFSAAGAGYEQYQKTS